MERYPPRHRYGQHQWHAAQAELLSAPHCTASLVCTYLDRLGIVDSNMHSLLWRQLKARAACPYATQRDLSKACK